jgi:hypothetical protein
MKKVSLPVTCQPCSDDIRAHTIEQAKARLAHFERAAGVTGIIRQDRVLESVLIGERELLCGRIYES